MKVTVLAIALMLIGVLGVLRAALIVASGTPGRFRADPWVSLLLGFAFLLIGQLLLLAAT